MRYNEILFCYPFIRLYINSLRWWIINTRHIVNALRHSFQIRVGWYLQQGMPINLLNES